MTRYHSIALVMISGLLACPAQVTGAADLSITKDDGVTSVTPGDPVTYTITVTNHGPSPVLAAYVEDIFSSKLKNVSWNAVGTGLAIYNPSGTDDITELVFLPPGAAITYNVTATVKPAASGTLFNTATIWSLQYDPDTSNNLASDNDTLTTPLEEADLVVTKDDGQATAERGEALAYTITVTNAGPDDANDVIVTDNFPAAALMNVNWTAAGTGGASGFPASGSGNINHTVDLPAGATITYGVTAVVQPFAPSSVINTATVSSLVSDPDPGNNVATDIDAVTGSPLPDADLVVTKDDGQDIVAPGDPVTYTIGITNVGPDPAVDVTVMDPKPAELLNMTWGAVGSGGATGFSATGTGSINDSGITLPPGGTVTYTVTGTVDPNATGALTNTVGASSLSADPDPSNNIASDTDAIIPPGKASDLAITKDDGQTSAVPGEPVVYTITVTNNGPNADVAFVSDIFSSKFAAVGWTAVGSGGAVYLPSGMGDINEGLLLPSGATVTYTVIAKVDASATGLLINVAKVWSLRPDPDPSNNIATDINTLTTPAEAADLVVTKDDGQATAVRGQPLTYTITVRNNGPDDVSNAIVRDIFPPIALWNVTWTAARTGGATGVPPSGTGNILHMVDLPVGATITYAVTAGVRPTAPPRVSNTVVISSPISDPDPSNNVATDVDIVTGAPPPEADLQVTKDDGQDIVAPGDTVTYTITITNAGPDQADDVEVKDPKPAEFLDMSWGAVGSGGATGFTPTGTGAINDSGITLPAGATLTYTVTGTVDPNASGAVTNAVGVASTTADPDASNNVASDTDAIIPPQAAADLAITKDDGQTNAVPGDPIVYTITVTNHGPNGDIAFVRDDFSGKLQNVKWAAVGSGFAIYNPSGTGDIYEPLVLGPGATVTYTVLAKVKPSATGMLINVAKVWSLRPDPDPSNNIATDIDTLTSPPETADLVVTKDDGQVTAARGQPLTYTITVQNAGPDDANAVITDVFPAAALVGTTWTAVGSGGASGFPASGSVDINHAVHLPAGATITYTVTAGVRLTAPAVVLNTVAVSSPITDPVPSNNVATDVDFVTGAPPPEADLEVTKDDGQDTVAPGETITYTIGLTNLGPDEANDVTVMDPKPADFINVSWGAVGSGGATGFEPTGTGGINDSGITLPPGATVTYTILGTVDPNATEPLTNGVGVSSTTVDPDATNNIATDTDTIVPPDTLADLSITKDDGQDTVIPGKYITYVITVQNAGPNDVIGATVADTFPTELKNVSWSAVQSGGASGFTASGSGDINDTGVDLPVGASVTYTVIAKVKASATGVVANTATVSGPVSDPNPANNSATDTDEITPQPDQADLSVTKDDGLDTAVPGQPVTYTITVMNEGPEAVTGATVTDTFPTALTGVTWTAAGSGGASGFTASGTGNISDTVDLPLFATVTYTVTGTVNLTATGLLINTVTVASGLADPDPTNNVATDTDVLSLPPVQAELSIEKDDGIDMAAPGQPIDYTITVANAGPNDVTGATVTDDLPAALTGVTWTATGSGGASGFTASGAGDINETVDLPAGASITYAVTATIDPTASGLLINTATVSADVSDPDPTNNSATDIDTLVLGADLSLTKSAGFDLITSGNELTYTLTVVNTGSSDANGVVVQDLLPDGVTFVSASTGCSEAGGVVTCNIGNVPGLSSVEVTITVSVDPNTIGTLTNVAGVSADEPDPNPANDAASATTAAQAPPVAICQDVTVVGVDCLGTVTPAQVNNGSWDPEGSALTMSLAPGSPYPIGVTTVTLTVQDDQGLTSTCEATVTVIDPTVPVFVDCPNDIVVPPDANSTTAVVTWTPPTVSEDCPPATVTSTHNPGDAFPIGTTTVTYTATNGSGGTSTCSFTVTVAEGAGVPQPLPPVDGLCPCCAGTGSTLSASLVSAAVLLLTSSFGRRRRRRGEPKA